jgi:hypothetical protein
MKKKVTSEDELVGFSREESAFIRRWTVGMDARTKKQFIAHLLKILGLYQEQMQKMHERGCW